MTLVGGVVLACLFFGPSLVHGQDLQAELYKLDRLRKGKQSPLEVVEQQAAELLKKYTALKDQGQIYYQLAHIYAQSGQIQPQQTIAHAMKALELPLEPVQKLKLYTYWGDALRRVHQKSPIAERRRQAAVPYLEGLREAGRYNLPEKAPELPKPPKTDLKPTDPGFIELFRKYQEEVKARELPPFQKDMMKHRDVLIGQLVEMYSKPPFATAELEALARKTLADVGMVEKLLSKVQVGVVKAEKTLSKAVLRAAQAQAAKTEPEERRDSSGQLWLVGGLGAVLLGLVVIYALRKSPKAPAASQKT
jgi:hypothetical protein